MFLEFFTIIFSYSLFASIMTSSLARNSQADSKSLYSAPKYMPGQYANPLIPLEEQVPSTTFTSTDVGNVTYTGALPRERNWIVASDLTAGSIIYAPTLANCNDMIGRDTCIAIGCTNGGANTFSLTLPTGWRFVYAAAAFPLVKQTATSPALATTAALLHITWLPNKAVITSPTTGWTFP